MSLIDELRKIVPSERVSMQADQLAVASKDESSLPGVLPMAVVWAENAEEVRQIIRYCYTQRIPITARGAGSALEGSTIPLSGGIVLDLSRMTRILNYWPEDLQIQVEPGIIYDNLNAQLKRDGLFFPPSPGGSGDIATIGGMVSTNASGIYSVKYGGTREYILALEVVTGTGERIRLGNRAVKRSSGYNLIDLVSGSEGTLAVITSITMRLAGLPEDRLQSAYIFPTEVAAAQAVSEMRRYGLDIAAIEFLDRNLMAALNSLKGYGLREDPALFLEFHGPRPVLESNSELADGICVELGASRIQLPEGQRAWEIRHWATEAIKHSRAGWTIVRNDVAFPISRLPEMVSFCHELGNKHEIPMFTFGHVGLGILHALMLADAKDPVSWQRAMTANNEIIRKTLEVDGTISGEHGIGLGHKDLFELEHGESVALMRSVKRQFDPANILNPGKIFD